MNPRHHLDPATVLAHAAGAIAPEAAAIVAIHLEACGECRRAAPARRGAYESGAREGAAPASSACSAELPLSRGCP